MMVERSSSLRLGALHLRRVAAAVFLAIVAVPVFSTGEALGQGSEEGALFLLLPVGGQGVGVARAMTALSGTTSGFWNPAGVVGLEGTRATIVRGDHIAGTITGASLLVPRRENSVFGVAYALLNSGDQDLTDDQGNVLGTISLRGHQGILTAGVPFGGRVRTGANLRWIQFRQSCRGQCPDAGVTATAYAMDLGAQFEPLGAHPLTLGLMVAHLGTSLKVSGSDQSSPLPARIRVGASYRLSWEVAEEEIRVRLLGEVEDRLRGLGDPSVYLATEVEAGSEDRVYIRGGYIFGNRSQIDGAGIGIGFRFDRFEFDLARSLARGGPAIEGEPVHISLGFAP